MTRKSFIYILSIVLAVIASSATYAQGLSDAEINQKLSLTFDSIKTYGEANDMQKVWKICNNGIMLLKSNDLYVEKPTALLEYYAGNACLALKAYSSAKMYFKNSFVMDEYAELGMDMYSSIKKCCQEESRMHYFIQLVDIAKSDSAILKLMVKDPEQLANNLNSVALMQYEKGEYASSTDYFEMELGLLESIDELGTSGYLSIFPCVVRNMEEMKNYKGATAIADDYINLSKYYKGENAFEYANAIQTKAGVEYTFGNCTESIILYNKALNIFEKIKGKENMDYIRCLCDMGWAYAKRDDNTNKRREFEEQAEILLGKAKDATSEDKAQNAEQLSTLYQLDGNRQKQLEYARKAVNYLEKDNNIYSLNYAYGLSSLCTSLTQTQNYEEAISTGEKSTNIFKRYVKTSTDSIGYRQAKGALAYAYFESGNISKAISLQEEMLASWNQDSEYKLGQMRRLITFYQRAGKYEEMGKLAKEQLLISEKIAGKGTPLYADALVYAADKTNGQTTGDEIMMLQEASDIYKKYYGENSTNFVRIQNMLVTLQKDTQANTESNNSGKSTLEQLKAVYGNLSREYFRAYLNQCSLGIGEKMTVTEKLTEVRTVLSQIKEKFGQHDELYLQCESYLARVNCDAYQILRDKNYIESAIECQKDVVKQSKDMYGENNIQFIRTVEDLAAIEAKYENPDFNAVDPESDFYKCMDEAIQQQQIACNYYKKEFGTENSRYAHAVKMMGDYYSKKLSSNFLLEFALRDEFKTNSIYQKKLLPSILKAIDLYQTALNIYSKEGDKDNIAYVLAALYFIHDKNHDNEKAASYLKQEFEEWKSYTLSEFSMLTGDEKNTVVNSRQFNSILSHYTMNAFYANPYNPTYNEVAYNVQLLNKGMLLSSEIGLRNLIQESGDEESITKYDRLIQIKSELSKVTVQDARIRLQKEYEVTERDLMKQSQQFGDYMKTLSVSWNDIQTSLNDKDVAIEFASYTTTDYTKNGEGRNTNNYYALVLKKSYPAPKMIKLSTEAELKNNDSLYYKVWKPLEEELKDVDNVYFSPILKLNNLPLESAKLPDGSIISEHGKRFLRLSSTRELVKAKNSRNYKSAVLYGGLQYDASVNDMVSSDKIERTNGLRGTSAEDEELESDLRSGFKNWKFLTGTKLEMDEICKITNDNNITAKPYTGTQGTESTFKNLSGKKKDFIHIATHGFYIRPKNNQSELEAMERSGLVFAGANNINKGVQLPEGVDNGLLTAAEVARMDLRNVDMVVMSACQTGLGDNTTSEGVYGLQRGFKKAGVNSLVMSLWSVPDPPTQMLMTEFYKNLFKGLSKYDSLEKAKTAVRTYNNGQYAAPRNWAGFILLDGLN